MPVAHQTGMETHPFPAVVCLTRGTRIPPHDMGAQFERIVKGDAMKSVCDMAVERFAKDIRDCHDSKFMSFDYDGELWISSYPVPEAISDITALKEGSAKRCFREETAPFYPKCDFIAARADGSPSDVEPGP